eukprot:g6809.t1
MDLTKTCLVVAFLIGTAIVPASVGGALSAHKQQCPTEGIFCAAVSRPRVGRWGFQSSTVDRGCASSLKVECGQPDSTSPGSAQGSRGADDGHGRRGASSS